MHKTAAVVHYVPDWPRAFSVQESIDRDASFTDTVASGEWALGTGRVCLIGLEPGELTYVGVATPGHPVATAKRLVRFSDLVQLDALDLDALEPLIEGSFRGRASLLLRGGRLGATWNVVSHRRGGPQRFSGMGGGH